MARAFGGLGVTSGLAADRSSLSGMVAGQQFFETDTNKAYVYNGSSWINVNNTTVEAMTVSSSGYVNFNYSPVFYANNNTGGWQTGTPRMVSPSNVLVNRGSHFNTSNGRFTAPIAGIYLFNYNQGLVETPYTTSHAYTWFYKNGVKYSGGSHTQYNATRYYEHLSNMCFAEMSAGDYMECWIYYQTSARGYTGDWGEALMIMQVA